MSGERSGNHLPIAGAIVVSALIVGLSVFAGLGAASTVTKTVTQTTVSTTTTVLAILSAPGENTTHTFQCIITGQPAGFFFRVVYDSNQTPVLGASVNATSLAAYCNNVPATTPNTRSFTTYPGTEWYSLGAENIAGYSIVVTYAGQTYSLSAHTAPISVTCATLFVPSGNTNVTIGEYQSSCPK